MKNILNKLVKESENSWRLPADSVPGMKADGKIFASDELLNRGDAANTLQQIVNAASLPKIVSPVLAMPDIHWGYGLPIGGIAAFNIDDGLISPGAVGSDINCGVRLIKTNLQAQEVKKKLDKLLDELFNLVPCGLGSSGAMNISYKELDKLLVNGSIWAVQNGYGWDEDIQNTEENGTYKKADPDNVSSRSKKRGIKQVGTLGSGNHFLEIQEIEEILDSKTAEEFGLRKGEIAVMLHAGSRGLGYQVCNEFAKWMIKVSKKYGIKLPDEQLASAPFDSTEGKKYFGAMASASNYAWANRQVITHSIREAFRNIFGKTPEKMSMSVLYDVAHNIAKIEKHIVNGQEKNLIIHRKGATRAFPAGHTDLPEIYKKTGQPVIIPGDMGSASYVLAGFQGNMELSFGSTCHGAGRVMSRRKAVKSISSRQIADEMKAKGVKYRYTGKFTMQEESPESYKDINSVVNVVEQAGISKRIAKLKPIGVIKG